MENLNPIVKADLYTIGGNLKTLLEECGLRSIRGGFIGFVGEEFIVRDCIIESIDYKKGE